MGHFRDLGLVENEGFWGFGAISILRAPGLGSSIMENWGLHR